MADQNGRLGRSQTGSPSHESESESEPTPTALQRLTSQLGPAGLQRVVQRRRAERRASEQKLEGEGLQKAAEQGVTGGGGPLPHRDAIQRSFGRHDVAGIVAHTGAPAARAADAMGAEAFATGHHVAFGDAAPTLHTAAHEAAHVIQQRGGVRKRGGEDEASDPHEQHADAVADKVVKGESAETLLDDAAGGQKGEVEDEGAKPEGGAPVQRKIRYTSNDTASTLKQKHKEQAQEIEQWESSPFEVAYKDTGQRLEWELTGDSQEAFTAEASHLFQGDAESLAGSSAIANEMWTIAKSKMAGWVYRDDVPINFRALILMHRAGDGLSRLLRNVYGSVRRQQIVVVQKVLRQAFGRPILEDDQAELFMNQPEQAKEWAERGWQMVTGNWAGIPPEQRPRFVDEALNHNKGYNRAQTLMGLLLTPETTAMKMAVKGKAQGWEACKDDKVKLFAKVIAYYSFNEAQMNPSVDHWRKFLPEHAGDIAEALAELQIDVSASAVKEFAASNQIGQAVWDAGYFDDTEGWEPPK